MDKTNCTRCPHLDRLGRCVVVAAADLIESQQAQLVAKDAEIARMAAERTAMIINAGNIDCDSCKHNGIGACEDIDPDCRNCAQECPCKLCDGTSKWEWRGATDN